MVQLDPVITALNILLVLVLVLILEILSKTEDENEDEDEEEGPSSVFSPPVNNRVKIHPDLRGDALSACQRFFLFHNHARSVGGQPIDNMGS
jgi:hypothetical protein